MSESVSIILPAKNEADSRGTLLPVLRKNCPEEEIIVGNEAWVLSCLAPTAIS